MKKVLIATSSACCADSLKTILEEEWEVHICTNGYTTIDTMKYLQPDALVLGLNMPQKDGIAILEESFPDIPPATLALSPLINDYVTQTCVSLGVKYLMSIPCRVEEIRNRLEDICRSLQQPPSATMQHLRVLGFDSSLDGYKQLLFAVPYFKEDPSRLLQKEVYPYVAVQCDATDGRCVEHSIRQSIRKAWKSHTPKVWGRYFPQNILGKIDCPTNREVIRTLAEKI